MRCDENETNGAVEALIHNRGRGPEIRGTRITVYDVVDYLLMAWEPARIAMWFKLMTVQVEAAIAYILDHKLEVIREYHEMLEREARGNPPESQARLDACRGMARKRAEELRQKNMSADDPHFAWAREDCI